MQRAMVVFVESEMSPARRNSLRTLFASCLLGQPLAVVQAHNDPGRVEPPLAVPPFRLTLQDGRRVLLEDCLKGRITAVQLMFTGCSATCPIQGALFSQVQERIAAERGLQLLSVTIDPLSDDPKAMRHWLRRFNAGERWHGATPDLQQLDRWYDFLRARTSGVDRHTAQVYFFNAKAELALRTADFPAAEDIARLMKSALNSSAATGLNLPPPSRTHPRKA
jgi:protein SCO1